MEDKGDGRGERDPRRVTLLLTQVDEDVVQVTPGSGVESCFLGERDWREFRRLLVEGVGDTGGAGVGRCNA
jgi:hypothetical protein